MLAVHPAAAHSALERVTTGLRTTNMGDLGNERARPLQARGQQGFQTARDWRQQQGDDRDVGDLRTHRVWAVQVSYLQESVPGNCKGEKMLLLRAYCSH